MDTQIHEYVWDGEKIPVKIDFGRTLSNDRIQQNLFFTYKNIDVHFYYLHESVSAYLVFDQICKNIDEYGEDWNKHFYYDHHSFYQDGNVVTVL